MAKFKTIHVCQQCGYSTSGWLGKCPSCDGWGTFAEEASDSSGQKRPIPAVRAKSGSTGGYGGAGSAGGASMPAKAYSLDEIDSTASEERIPTGISELDRVLGGGIVKGSLILVGGDPGIGKSTLLLQMCATQGLNALYVSGEESVGQIQMRSRRLDVHNGSLRVAAETRLGAIMQLLEDVLPQVVIVDSIQTMYDDEISGAPGSVGQIRGVTMELMSVAKGAQISFIIVGHVTKDGSIAGPKVLEHMVDTVLYFEGERSAGLRILRAVKNRFGSTNEIGVFDMSEEGLVEVENPSARILGERPRGVPGSIVVPNIEGTRSMLVEIQALASHTNAQMPRRMATGVDYNRMTLMIAVLEKRIGLKLYDCDVFVNVTGGLKLYEPACDLGIIAAIASSFRDKAFDPDMAMIGEVGLTGEVRSIDQLDKRLNEAARLGFQRCVVPEGNLAAGKLAASNIAAGNLAAGKLAASNIAAGNLAAGSQAQKGSSKNLEVIPVKHIIKVFDLFV